MARKAKPTPAPAENTAAAAPAESMDFAEFMNRLGRLTDAARLSKAVRMLKAERFQLFSQVEKDSVVGVVKSQTDPDLAYSCRLDAKGNYGCCTQNLNRCGGLQGRRPCKHLLVLLIGLTRSGELEPAVANKWLEAARYNGPVIDKDAMGDTFLKYKGAEAGEVDWRPTETIPEDYYAL
jgi:hypothetical protein